MIRERELITSDVYVVVQYSTVHGVTAPLPLPPARKNMWSWLPTIQKHFDRADLEKMHLPGGSWISQIQKIALLGTP